MKITCPGCGFARDADEDKLPPAAAVATCPRCKERFRFREPAAPDGENGEETRRQAAEAYRRAAELPSVDARERVNPWENPRDGYAAAFYQTAVRVLFVAPRFFAGLEPRQKLTRALIFYLLVGIIQIAAEQFWLAIFAEVLAPRAESDPQLALLLSVLSPEMSLPLFMLMRTAIISLELFIAAFLYHLAFRMLVPDKANFSIVFQVVAYASAPALLGIVPVLGSLTGFIWSVACGIIGCRHALRISWMQTALALGPLYFVIFFLFLQMGAASPGM